MHYLKYKLLVLCFLILPIYVVGQEQGSNRYSAIYHNIDQYACTVKYIQGTSTDSLTDVLIKPYRLQIEKARVIFSWIAHNITYDYKVYYKIRPYSKDPDEMLRRQQAVCAGYAALYKTMCTRAGVNCIYVLGFGKHKTKQMGHFFTRKQRHAWNLVEIDSVWYPVDVTWAAGHSEWFGLKYYKEFNDAYFLTNPAQFNLEHMPDKTRYQLVDDPIMPTAFINKPTLKKGYFIHKIQSFSPSYGVIQVSKGDSITFSLRSANDHLMDKITIKTKEGKYTDVLHATEYTRTLSFHKRGRQQIVIEVNGDEVILYEIKVVR
jgi:transglutaminase/protease-like cytokinesis protein 3